MKRISDMGRGITEVCAGTSLCFAEWGEWGVKKYL